MTINEIYNKDFNELKEKFKLKFNTDNNGERRNKIYIPEKLLISALKSTYSCLVDDRKMLDILEHLANNIRCDRFRDKGYSNLESDLDDLASFFEDVIYDLLSYGEYEGKRKMHVELDICNTYNYGYLLKVCKLEEMSEPTSPIRYEFLQPNNSFSKMLIKNISSLSS